MGFSVDEYIEIIINFSSYCNNIINQLATANQKIQHTMEHKLNMNKKLELKILNVALMKFTNKNPLKYKKIHHL